MNVGIVGLGLIGGSFAKAYHKGGHTVYATDTDLSTLDFAQLSGAVAAPLTRDNLGSCDLVLICVYPGAAVGYMRENAEYFGARPIVMDCCGTKRDVVPVGFELSNAHGFTYVGAHPMAGRQYSGFKYATDALFHGAPMVIVPQDHNDIELLGRIKQLLAPAGFARISVTTAEAHDEMIAFTSQLAHVVSSAYIKSPTARRHRGFSAGSYKDMTRVAWLNPEMWAELFLDNRDNLINELDILIDNLNEYRDALDKSDRARLHRLLDDGRRIKEEVDGR